MNREERERILYRADDLQRLARNLEMEAANWLPPDKHQDNVDESEDVVSKARNNVLWGNAVEAGIVIFELCGLGAFENQTRVKNVVCQVRSELKDCLQEFNVPYSHVILNIPYGMRTGRSYDVFFVKLFESFCKVWIKTPEEHRAFKSYYDALKIRAQLHAKLMSELGENLKSHFGNTSEITPRSNNH